MLRPARFVVRACERRRLADRLRIDYRDTYSGTRGGMYCRKTVGSIAWGVCGRG
jgi:hypothetical protein